MFKNINIQNGARNSRSIFFTFLTLLAVVSIFANSNQYEKKLPMGFKFAWPADLIEHLVVGFKLPMADFFWLRFIQDISYKDNNLNGKTHLGWGYHMVDAITNLDRRFRIVYIAAGTILSVEVEDTEGARRVMEKGVANIPTDWSLEYRLAYHYLYEVKDCSLAAKHLNAAGKNGAPSWVASLAARLYTASAQYQLAYTVILENLERFKDTEMEPVLLQRKKELEMAMKGLKVNPNHPSSKLCQ